jgi:hypothetical protein
MMKRRRHHSLTTTAAIITALVACALWARQAQAYPTWSDGAGNGCIACHGDFNSGTYVSNSDGTSWGTNLMQGHINFMGGSACNICHQPSARFPVYIGLSIGITNYPPIACLGCHGRSEDATGNCVEGNTTTIDPANCGMGAGLRRHHANAGVTECADCHTDAVPVGENVQPPYYFSDSNRPNKPLDPCNLAPSPGNENKFGSTGLDNDGDLAYDQADPDCISATATPTSTPVPPTPTNTPVPPTATPTNTPVPPTPTPTNTPVSPTATPTNTPVSPTPTPTNTPVPPTATPTSLPGEVEVLIDVKPGSDVNPINLRSRGVIPVAILGSADFSVMDLDRTTLRFGHCGNEGAAARKFEIANVNGDGIADLVTRFRTQDTNLVAGDTVACLVGATKDGRTVHGMDSVTTRKGGSDEGRDERKDSRSRSERPGETS